MPLRTPRRGKTSLPCHWPQAGIALESESTIMKQPRGPQLEYRVKAMNTGGESPPSNTVAVVL